MKRPGKFVSWRSCRIGNYSICSKIYIICSWYAQPHAHALFDYIVCILLQLHVLHNVVMHHDYEQKDPIEVEGVLLSLLLVKTSLDNGEAVCF